MPQILIEVPESLVPLMSALLMTAAMLLAVSLNLVRKLVNELPRSANRGWWRLLGALIMLFLLGYLGFLGIKVGGSYTSAEMLVVLIFFLGSVFALLVCLLALRTTRELKRIYVLEQEAITDPLLGIFNRRCLDRKLKEEILRAKRHRLELGVLMVDIDHFKAVNDNWGHQTGDLVLQHVAKLLLGSLRQTDIIARYGGEEIVVLLPHTPCPEGKEVAARLRRTVEETPLQLRHKTNGVCEVAVTVSIGCACFNAAQDSPQSLLERADEAMYRAKRQGRNQVVCGEPVKKEPSAA